MAEKILSKRLLLNLMLYEHKNYSWNNKHLRYLWWQINCAHTVRAQWFKISKVRQTVNSDLYCEQLDCLNQNLIRIVKIRGVILQHSDRSHASRKIYENISGLGWEILPHLLHSPDITAFDYYPTGTGKCLWNKKLRNWNRGKMTLEQYFSLKKQEFYKPRIFTVLLAQLNTHNLTLFFAKKILLSENQPVTGLKRSQ